MQPIDSTNKVIRRHFMRRAWHLLKPYFTSEERWSALLLLVATLFMNAAVVGVQVYLTNWNGRFYNALQQYNISAFPRLVVTFFIGLAFFIALVMLGYYFQSLLQLRWRRWLTYAFSSKWINHSRYYQLELNSQYADNPDQRITEDIDNLTNLSLSLFIGLFGSVISLVSYLIMLWHLSGSLDFTLFGYNISIPHYMIVVAFVYSMLANWLAHLVGRKLISINYYKEKVEANLRFGLIRLRENGRAIAQMKGEEVEKAQIADRFKDIWYATRALITYTKRLTGYSTGVLNLGNVFPLFAAAPQYFTKQITLGTLMQTSSAFTNVQSALSWFVNSYQDLTSWRAVIERLDNFNLALDELPEPLQRPGQTHESSENTRPELNDLELALPQGTSMLSIDELILNKGEHTLIEAPSGSGKSLLFGVMAGNWPFWQGRVRMPTSAFFVPQTPYLPIGTLSEVLAYPGEVQTYQHEQLEDALRSVGLPHLVNELDERAHWERRLSPGEKQRISFARVLLKKPEWLFMDEATAALDLPAEQALYQLLIERLPETTIVSIAHKNTLAHFHPRTVTLKGHRQD